jgi:sugar/nucleoside kinase (ribokinase family)
MPSLPKSGELRATGEFLLDTGGCAANVATCLSRLGIKSSVSGRVGSDAFGEFILGDLHSKGANVSGIRKSTDSGTSKTVILPVIGEDRRYIHTFGANAEFSVPDIEISSLEQSAILYLGGFLILPAMDANSVARLFRTAKAMGARTVLDVVVPAGSGAESMGSLSAILPYTDYFLPNDEEGHALTGEADPYRQAGRFRELGCDTAVITCGNKGTLLMTSSGYLEAPAYSVDVVDCSGAGDAFAAGFIAGVLSNRDMADALRLASAVGASACTRLGCTPGVFTREEATAFMHLNPLEIRAEQA